MLVYFKGEKMNKMQVQEERKSIIFSLAMRRSVIPLANHIGNMLVEENPNFEIYKNFGSMREILGTLGDLKDEGRFEDVKLMIVDSAPLFFDNPNSEELALMKKYDIVEPSMWNSEFNKFYNTESNSVAQYVKNIVHLIQGEYPELKAKVCVLCDGVPKIFQNGKDGIALAVDGSARGIFDKIESLIRPSVREQDIDLNKDIVKNINGKTLIIRKK